MTSSQTQDVTSGAGRLEIYLLGHLRLFYNGEPFPFKAPPKTTPLWAYLLLRRGEPVSRQTLAFTLWPDEPERVAKTNLRRHLHYLKRALPPASPDQPWLRLESDTIRWHKAANWWLDVAAFEQLATDKDSAAEAVRLYTGDLLEDQYDEWLLYQRERLRNLYVAALNQLVQRFWSRRDYTQAIHYASQLLAYDPLREDSARQLVALRYQAGDRAGALKEFELFRQHLTSELGVEPMPETMAVHEAILRDKALPRPAQIKTETAPPAHQLLQLPFAGRKTEMASLQNWWRDVARGQGRLLLVGGDAGVGKTRLMEEFARLAESQGGRVISGTTLPTTAVPYQAMLAALRSALPMLPLPEIEPVWLAAVAPLLPELQVRCLQQGIHLPQLPGDDPERDRLRLFEGIAICLEKLAQPRPVLLILEDLHGAGAGTLALLEWLSRRGLTYPLFILATYRQEETGRLHPLRDFRRRLQGEGLLTHLALGGLSRAAVRELTAHLTGLNGSAAELSEQLYRLSEGNPLFLLELIQDNLAAGRIPLAETYRPPAGGEHTVLLQRIRSIIEGRVARLSPPANVMMEIMAVIGNSFNIELLSEVSGWRERQVLDSLDELLDQRMVKEVANGRFDYTFTHDLIATTIYDALPETSRQRRHRRVAHVLESLTAAQPGDFTAELAWHFDRGAEPARAAVYYLKAATRAWAVYAEEKALAALERGLAIADEPRLRFDLLALREEIAHRRGHRSLQTGALDALSALVPELNDPDLVCELLRRRIRQQRTLGHRQLEGELVARLQAEAEAAGLTLRQAQALQDGAMHQIALSHYETAGHLLHKALRLYRSLADVEGQVTCLCLLAEIGTYQSRFDQVQDLLQQARRVGDQGSQALMVRTLRASFAAAFARQEYQTALTLARQMLEICRAIGERQGEADALSHLATVMARLFRVEEARQYSALAADLYRKLGQRRGEAAVMLNAGMFAASLGRADEGISLFRRAEKLFESLADRRGLAITALNLSAALIFQEEFGQAEEAARRSLELARQLTLPHLEVISLGNLGEIAFNLGHLEQAIAYLEEDMALRRSLDLPVGDSAADQASLALAYLRAGRLTEAAQAADELLALHASDAPTIIHPQLPLWAAARIKRALGETAPARALLAQAYTTLQEKADAIPDPESRAAFLHFPFNRALSAAYEQGVWPDEE